VVDLLLHFFFWDAFFQEAETVISAALNQIILKERLFPSMFASKVCFTLTGVQNYPHFPYMVAVSVSSRRAGNGVQHGLYTPDVNQYPLESTRWPPTTFLSVNMSYQQ
jgi:hypothetical protein